MSDKLFIIKVINAVKKHPCIWDTTFTTYGNREALEKAWHAIGVECEKPASFCKEKWKNVRTGYYRSLRVYSNLNSSAKRPFYLYEHLQFMLPIFLRNEPSLSTVIGVLTPTASATPTSVSDPECTNTQDVNDVSSDSKDNLNNELIVKIEDSSSSDVFEVQQPTVENTENVEEDSNVLQKEDGYFSQFGPSSSNRSDSAQLFNNYKVDEPFAKKQRTSIDEQSIRETKEEQSLMSFFKGISSDVLSLSIHNQRFFKRKIVELVDDLHREEENTQMKSDRPLICFSKMFNDEESPE